MSGGQRVPLVEQRTGEDSWDFSRPDLPGDAAASADVDLADIDCATPDFCVAVGTYIDDSPEPLYLPLIQTWDGEGWTASSPALPGDSGFTEDVLLADVECAAVGACVAVGRYDENVDGNDVPLVLALAGGTWTSPAVAVPAGSTGRLNAVACPTAGACVAVGEETTSGGAREPLVVTGPGTWTVNTSVGLPATADPDDPQTQLHDVSCSAAGACVASGSYFTDTSQVQGLLEVLASTTWTPLSVTVPWEPAPNTPATNPRLVPHLGLVREHVRGRGRLPGRRHRQHPAAAARADQRDHRDRRAGCGARRRRGCAERERDGPSACAAGNRCLGVGFYTVDPGLSAPLLSGLDAGAWGASAGPRPDDLGDSARPLASTLDGSEVVAVGYYVDVNGFTRALLMLDLPI